MKDPKESKNPDCPDADDDRTSREDLPPPPRPEIPTASPRPEIPPKPSRDLPQPDRERAENEGMIPHEDVPDRPAAPPP